MIEVLYRISATHPETHLFDVECTVFNPDPMGQQFKMPAFIPGSYMIRDFAKHIVVFYAKSNNKTLKVKMLDKQTWQVEPTHHPLTVFYQVFAYDLTPRGAHVDTTHAFFNGALVFMQVLNKENLSCQVDILPPDKTEYHDWRVATSLLVKKAPAHGFGSYWACNYEDLIDHPVEMGHFQILPFKAGDVHHELILIGRHQGDAHRLAKDLASICEYHIHFFKGKAPFDRYVFLLRILPGGYGGLEHCFSSSSHISPECLPRLNDNEITLIYRDLLRLLSHEYFHAWHVKRIKPKAFSFDLSRENNSSLLWLFEGITSYFDTRALLKTGLMSKEDYLDMLSQTITKVLRGPGRFKQTLEQSGFLAWTKYYKPDENTINAVVDYYHKGALVGLSLDLLLRLETKNQISLDSVMQTLWERYGVQNIGLSEEAFEKCVNEISGRDLTYFFDKVLRSTEELPLESLLEFFGMTLNKLYASSMEEGAPNISVSSEYLKKRPLLEIKLKSNSSDAEIAYVLSGSQAEKAGLAPHDVIIAVNNYKVSRSNFESVIANYNINEVITLHLFRRHELMSVSVILSENSIYHYQLKRVEKPTDSQAYYLNAWL